MRILHIATLVSPDGAYGGPIRVAINQLTALQARGHQVVLAAGGYGFKTAFPTLFEGVPVRLFQARRLIPRSGFAGLTAPGLDAWVRAHASRVDIAHIHLARDLVTMPAARTAHRSNLPYVLQTHGMIDPSSKRLAGPLDAILTRRLLSAAKTVFYLTEAEKADLTAVADAGKPIALQRLTNGVPNATQSQAQETQVEVLFLARLHQRKRPDIFVRASAILASRHPDVRFTIIGADEGMGRQVVNLIASSGYSDRIVWEGSVAPDQSVHRMRRAAIYVLPSINEPFPMSVLEALSVGLPVVVTESCGIADTVRHAGAGIVVDESLESLVAGIHRLIVSSADRTATGNRAHMLSQTSFGMDAVVEQLQQTYAYARRVAACE